MTEATNRPAADHGQGRDHVESYNYTRFRSRDYDLAVFEGPPVGSPVPNITLTTLDGESVNLTDFHGRSLVLETGSVTCPMYAKNVRPMLALAEEFREVEFAVLYVREAHPGERIGPHHSSEDKAVAATKLEDRLGERRTILLDSLDGAAHRRLGLLPNMVYVIDADGLVLFRGDWTDPEAVRAVLAGTASTELLAREHFPPAKPAPATALRTLLAGGVTALFDFAVGLPGLLVQHRRADRAQDTAGRR